VPRLRFPEFENVGEWEVKRLGEVLDYERPDKYIVNSENYTDNGVPVLTANKSFILGYTNEAEGVCENLPAIIFDDFTTDKKFVDFPFKVKSSAIKILRPKGKNDLKFIFELMSLIRFEAKEHKRYYISAYQNLTVQIPNPAEQQKIASCLSSLDEVIRAESQKLELYQQHKKGLLQNLFPNSLNCDSQGLNDEHDFSKVPKLRFPEFEESGEWVEKLVGEYFTVGSSKRVLQEDWTNHGVPFYRTRELVSLSKNEPFKSEVFISEELFSELKERYSIPTEGDFLVSGVGTLGICYQVQSKDKFYFKDGNVLWFKLEKGLNSTYFKYCFQSEHIQNQIIGQTSKSTVGTYTIQNAKKTKFWYPPTIKEQQKIAACLSSLDDLINAQTQKIEMLQRHKKGLLQGLFPPINN
jgi:type I restriction enzyme S subunit